MTQASLRDAGWERRGLGAKRRETKAGESVVKLVMEDGGVSSGAMDVRHAGNRPGTVAERPREGSRGFQPTVRGGGNGIASRSDA